MKVLLKLLVRNKLEEKGRARRGRDAASWSGGGGVRSPPAGQSVRPPAQFPNSFRVPFVAFVFLRGAGRLCSTIAQSSITHQSVALLALAVGKKNESS
jgi:hypothetical protein